MPSATVFPTPTVRLSCSGTRMLPVSQPHSIDELRTGEGPGAEQDLRHAVLEGLECPVFLLQCQGQRQTLIYANRAFERWAGRDLAALRGGDWRTLSGLAAEDPGLARLQSCLRDGRGGLAVVRTQPLERPPGWAQLRLTALPVDSGCVRFIGQLRDVTAEMREREQLRRQALHDSLTGLPNRRLLQIRLERAIARSREDATPFALVFLDLDRFKQVNDSLGHETADALLRQVGRRLRHGVRPQDTVARLYGDEFALLITPLPCEQSAELISRRIAAWLREPFAIEGMRLIVSCSVGVVLYPDGTDGQHLLGSADRDMYRHKRIGQPFAPAGPA